MSGFVFSQKPITIESGEGVHLYDDEEREYLDMGASYACTPLGHSHPAVVSAVTEQVAKLTFVQGSYPVDIRDELQDRLAGLAPGNLENVWLCNSGTEANEAALKFARHATGRSKIVATKQAFHGRTMGSLAATWNNTYREGFEPLAGDVEFVDYDDPEALAGAVDEETAAVILEPIQGEGGINPASESYLKHAREVTEEAGAALIFDEIQTGVGRTGTLWASEQAGVVPDVLTTAKGIANGLPMGATLVADWIAENPGSHGGTFSGGPTIAAAANATLSILESADLPANAAERGAALRSGIESELEDVLRDVRGRGLMIGVEVKRNANAAIRELALEKGILTLPAGRTVIRLLPPLVLEPEHVSKTVDAMADVLPETTEP
ncbi:MAG: aspartate aminotransferase family protein [Halodesulfurarchaeum sp.]